MPYDEQLANRIRERFADLPNVVEKSMMGGLTFMYNDKMCVGIVKNELMCRIDPALHDEVTTRKGCHTMDFTNRPMSGFIMVRPEGIIQNADFDYYINLALEYNKQAKPSKKRKK